MKHIKLTATEKDIEEKLLRGEFIDIDKKSFDDIAHAVSARRKDAVLNIRVNSNDLKFIKVKASKLGVKYQTLISEIIHRVAHGI